MLRVAGGAKRGKKRVELQQEDQRQVETQIQSYDFGEKRQQEVSCCTGIMTQRRAQQAVPKCAQQICAQIFDLTGIFTI